jgi:hypothetical protein
LIRSLKLAPSSFRKLDELFKKLIRLRAEKFFNLSRLLVVVRTHDATVPSFGGETVLIYNLALSELEYVLSKKNSGGLRVNLFVDAKNSFENHYIFTVYAWA